MSSAAVTSVSISVDVAASRHAISPNVYGVAYATQAQLADLNVPLNRRGGNNTSRYNWQVNADNRGSDWYFESLPYSGTTPGDDADQFVSSSKAAGAQAMVTIPTIGWVAKLGSSRSGLSSFSVKKYGAQQSTDAQWFPDAGNGVHTDGTNVTGNDPNDANVLVDSTYQQGWVNHLTGRFGTSQNGGVRYYILDNEPSIWQSTHRDVHPVGPQMDEIRDKLLDYSLKVKQADGGAQVVAPEEWGWSGYFYSGYDQQYGAAHNYSSFPDRTAHNNWDYLPYLLDQWRQRDAALGQRTLDVFAVHYYPQSGEFSSDTSSAMQLTRNKTTRSLWDPSYVDPSWINDKVMLIPRLKQWVNTYYPGTKIGITEYNWGAEGHINGATTLADVWGIFGREALDLATYWTVPNTGTPAYNAMKLYRNYDGQKSTFGDMSVSATVPNPDQVAAFAAQRSSDGALTLMVINKTTTATAVNMNVANFTVAGAAQAWQLTSANQITRLADVALSANVLSTSLPAQSITLFVLGGSASSTGPTLASVGVNPASVAGGSSSTGTVTLSAAAPAGGAAVALSSSSASAVVPASVLVPVGASNATFTITTSAVSANTTATITATYGSASQTSALTVTAPQPTFRDTTTVSPSPVNVGSATTITAQVTCSTATLANGNVDIEVYNSLGTQVGQKTVAAQSFTAGQTRTYTYAWTPTTAGTYTVKVGVFNTDWSLLYYWNDAAASVSTVSAPAAPTGLTAAAGDAQVSLAWTASAGAISYNVKRAGTSGGPYTTVASSVTTTSKVDAGLTNGTTYYYVVTAVNAAGESGNSTQASATPQASTYTVSGTVTVGGVGVGGVRVSGGPDATTTAPDGTYTLRGFSAGAFGVYAATSSYFFPTQVATLGPSRTGVNFSAPAGTDIGLGGTYTVSGKVTVGGLGVGGVWVSGGPDGVMTAADGTYILRGISSGAFGIYAATSSYSFPPQVVTLGPSRTGVNFSAPAGTDIGVGGSYTVSGTVTVGGIGVGGVRVSGGPDATTTAPDGTYTLRGFSSGAFGVYAATSSYSFPTQVVTLGPSRTGVNFSAPAGTDIGVGGSYTVSGKVTVGGVGVGGVRVSGGPDATTTAPDGTYTLRGFSAGAFAIYASSPGNTFARQVVYLGPSQIGVNFVGQ